MKFKVGDRVAVYYGTCRRVGTLEDNPYSMPEWQNTVWVHYDCGHPRKEHAHYKQCRLLKKKERRKIWVHEGELPKGRIGCLTSVPQNREEWIEFVEVKKK